MVIHPQGFNMTLKVSGVEMYDLKKLQEKELDILKAVHSACEELDIEYVIMHGTLLGAVRHKGFIPWDDDIDICMTRDNYDRFIREGQAYLPGNLRIQHYTTEKECPNFFAKVRDINTTFLHKEHVDLHINQGVFIDIFPVERIPAEKHSISVEHRKRRVFAILNECVDMAYIRSIHRISSRIIGNIIHFYMSQIVLKKMERCYFIQREDERRRRLHKQGDDCCFISIYKNITGPFSIMTRRKLYEFEGEWFFGPEDYDTPLRLLYGDYMKIPPKEAQITHEPLFVDLERGYTKEELSEILQKQHLTHADS
ncbi:MAG: LicD family protein [Oscillospiraceae bacterium]|nr:LicD family protein [Oscillospiraceae bacterium]